MLHDLGGTSMSLSFALSILLFLTGVVAMVFAVAWHRVRDRQQSLASCLLASESQYRQLLSVADLAIAVLDEACHIVDWNPVLEQLYGLPRQDVLGRQFFMCCAPEEEAAALTARMMAMHGSDAVLEFGFAVCRATEEERQLRWRARYFTDVRDGRRYLSLVGHDVTAVQSMQRWLADSEARFRLMFESVPAAQALLDDSGRLLMVNPAWARFFAYDAPEQMVMLNVQALVHEADRQACDAALAALQSQKESLYQMEKRYIRRNGDHRWGHMRCTRLSLAPGQVFLLAQISDVHERKQTELALLEGERRLASLIANLSGAVYCYELPVVHSGLHHDRPADFLSEGIDVLGGQPRNPFASGQPSFILGTLIAPEDRPVLLAALESAMAGSGQFEVTYRLHHGLSSVRWVKESGRVWRRPDMSWTVDGHITDITAERQTHEAEQAYRTLVTETRHGFVCISLEGRVLKANESFCVMLGVDDPEYLLGKSLDAFMPPGRERLLPRFLDRATRAGVLRDLEFTFPGADGAEITVLVNTVATVQGGLPAIKCLLFDISRTRQDIAARASGMAEGRAAAVEDREGDFVES